MPYVKKDNIPSHCNMQTADRGPELKCRLRVKCRLQIIGKMQTVDFLSDFCCLL